MATFIVAIPSLSSTPDSILENYLKSTQINSIEAQEISIRELENLKQVQFNKVFLKNILFYTPSQYLQFGTKDKCSFYDLILANLIRDKKGEIQIFYLDIVNNKKIKTVSIGRKAFIKQIIPKVCPESLKFAQYFQLSYLQKTLSKLELKTPQNLEECKSLRKKLIFDHKSPYYCYLNKEIKKINSLKNQISLTTTSQYKALEKLKTKLRKSQKIAQIVNINAQGYINNFCTHMNNEQKFCGYFLNENFYKKIEQKIEKPYHIKNHCLELFKSFHKKSLKTCISQLKSNDNICINLNKFDKALLPKPSCNQISKALNHSSLYTNYHDCPGQVNNETMINISRLYYHFASEEPFVQKDCMMNTTSTYASYNLAFNGEETWGTKACFDDTINNEYKCYSTVLGKSDNEQLSLEKNIHKILSKKRGIRNNTKCSIINKSSYNPILLKYKSGCFILKGNKGCAEKNCDIEVILDQEKINFIDITSTFKDEYFASTYQGSGKSQQKLLTKNLNLKTKSIFNTTILKEQFKNHPHTILHAIGCKEHLYPSLFQLSHLGQCSAIGIIIDGYIENNSSISLIVRSSIDALHSPRIIHWQDLFNSIKGYQSRHPLSKWTLYALY
ncbi:MAG: hypothetical protein N4A33_13350 [Bacteriovoracaceae bacterium]|nr:hypothetical protein [Bacteriovoracaceae bacterium]